MENGIVGNRKLHVVLVLKDPAELPLFFVRLRRVEHSAIFWSRARSWNRRKNDFIKHLRDDLLFGFVHCVSDKGDGGSGFV